MPAARLMLVDIHDRPELTALIKESIAKFNAMSSTEQEEILQAQRESWVRGQVGFDAPPLAKAEAEAEEILTRPRPSPGPEPAGGAIPRERAKEAAQRLINSAFGNADNRARFSIPANPDRDDDLVLMRYIEQQASPSAPQDVREIAELLRWISLNVLDSNEWQQASPIKKVAARDKLSLLASALTTAHRQGREAERAAVVAWLRTLPTFQPLYGELASRLERADHIKPQEG